MNDMELDLTTRGLERLFQLNEERSTPCNCCYILYEELDKFIHGYDCSICSDYIGDCICEQKC